MVPSSRWAMMPASSASLRLVFPLVIGKAASGAFLMAPTRGSGLSFDRRHGHAVGALELQHLHAVGVDVGVQPAGVEIGLQLHAAGVGHQAVAQDLLEVLDPEVAVDGADLVHLLQIRNGGGAGLGDDAHAVEVQWRRRSPPP